MSIITVHTVFCDGCEISGESSNTVQEARWQAKRTGWHYIWLYKPRAHLADLCPDCWAKREKEIELTMVAAGIDWPERDTK